MMCTINICMVNNNNNACMVISYGSSPKLKIISHIKSTQQPSVNVCVCVCTSVNVCQQYAKYLYIFHALFTSDRPISALHVRVIRRPRRRRRRRQRRRNGGRNGYGRRKAKKKEIIKKKNRINNKLTSDSEKPSDK